MCLALLAVTEASACLHSCRYTHVFHTQVEVSYTVRGGVGGGLQKASPRDNHQLS